jgi:hypothetical protein
VATPLRFRRSNEHWTEGRVRSDLLQPLQSKFGASLDGPWYKPPAGYEARRLEMDNGDLALFCWTDDHAFWLGNTETPKTLWRTEKYTFAEVDDGVAEWGERELLATLYEEEPWLESFPNLARFFLPVLLSKDGRHTAREFFRDYAAGFPDTDRDVGLTFYEDLLDRGIIDDRYTMAAKLGTSEQLNLDRMRSSMSEFTVARLLDDADYDLTPEIEVATGHSIDFRAIKDGDGTLVEVTRPRPPGRRSANSAVKAIRETAETKSTGQLQEHGGGITLFVDCSSFPESDWGDIVTEKPEVRHRPAVVFRAWPEGYFEGYTKGSVPIDLPETFTVR